MPSNQTSIFWTKPRPFVNQLSRLKWSPQPVMLGPFPFPPKSGTLAYRTFLHFRCFSQSKPKKIAKTFFRLFAVAVCVFPKWCLRHTEHKQKDFSFVFIFFCSVFFAPLVKHVYMHTAIDRCGCVHCAVSISWSVISFSRVYLMCSWGGGAWQ